MTYKKATKVPYEDCCVLGGMGGEGVMSEEVMRRERRTEVWVTPRKAAS